MKYSLICILLVLICSCTRDYSPKPLGYFRIELNSPVYKQFSDSLSNFTFKILQETFIETVPDTAKGERFNIVYPSLNAKIYCSLLSVKSKTDLIEISEDSRKFAYKHVVKADKIIETTYSDPHNKVSALIYDIGGNVASPLQFAITDSVRYFFLGALYFNEIPNQDSIAPIKEYIRNDIQELITSFRWIGE